jgi:hypothetical protein
VPLPFVCGFRLGNNRQQLRRRLRMTTKNPLAILVAPLKYSWSLHRVHAPHGQSMCPVQRPLQQCVTSLLRNDKLASALPNWNYSPSTLSSSAQARTLSRRPSDDTYVSYREAT